MSGHVPRQPIRSVGLLGGSFDPVHLAHIALAQAAHDTLGLDQIQLLPAANPWQRRPLSASAEHRAAMLRLAARHLPYIQVNTIEIERGGPTYTLDTLKQLPDNVQYTWLLGSDQLANFCSWNGWQEITQRVRLAVAQRPGSSLTPPPELQHHLKTQGLELLTLPFQPMPISATDIRQRLAQGLSTKGLLNLAVARYIQDNNLYRNPQG